MNIKIDELFIVFIGQKKEWMKYVEKCSESMVIYFYLALVFVIITAILLCLSLPKS